jgi:hypothetical protein
MDETKLILKKLLLKYDYLESYLEEVNFKYAKYNTQFLKEYYELNPPPKKPETPIPEEHNEEVDNEESTEEGNNKEPNEDDQEPKEKENPDKDSCNDEIECDVEIDEENDLLRETLNKLYKKLSLKTHPDKHGGNNELFIEVLNAYKSKNILKLIRLAKEFNIDYVLSDEIVTYIEEDITKIESKIHELQHHVCWLWCNADEDTKMSFKLP